MSDLDKAFDQEQDLSNSFDNEQDLGDVSQGESAIRGAIQGATLGYSDELAGALGAAASPMQVLGSDDKIGKLKELYQRYRDMERAKNDAAEQANPKTYMAGNVAGGIGAGLTGIGATEGLLGALGVGAAAGLGASKADLTKGEIGHAALDTGIGAALGGVGHGVAKTLGAALSPSAAQDEAAQSMAFAAGAKGLPSNKAKVGEALLQSGALKGGLSEDGLGAIRQAAQAAEDNLQPLLQQAKSKLSQMDPEDVAAAVGGDAGDKVYQLLQDNIDKMKFMSDDVNNYFGENIAPTVQKYIMQLKDAGNDPVALNEIKRAAYGESKKLWDRITQYQRAQQVPPEGFEDSEKIISQIGTTIKDHIEALANYADPGKDGVGGLGDKIAENNYYAGGLSGAIKAVTSQLTKGDPGIKTGNVMEYGYHPKWAIAKDIIKNLGSSGIAMSKANALNKWGNALESTGVGENLSNAASAVANNAFRATPTEEKVQSPFNRVFGAMSGSSASSNEVGKPAQVSKDLYSMNNDELKQVADSLSVQKGYENYGRALNKALSNNDMSAKNAALFVLAQQPDTRKMLQEKGLLAK